MYERSFVCLFVCLFVSSVCFFDFVFFFSPRLCFVSVLFLTSLLMTSNFKEFATQN